MSKDPCQQERLQQAFVLVFANETETWLEDYLRVTASGFCVRKEIGPKTGSQKHEVQVKDVHTAAG